MILTHSYYLDPIELTEEQPQTLIIERGDYFRSFVSELISQTISGNGEFVLSEGSMMLDLNKNAVVISDILSLEFDSRQIKNRLIQDLVLDCDETIVNNVVNSLNNLGYSFASKSKHPISFNMNLTVSELVKLLDFRIDTEPYTDIENIFEYISVCSELLGKRLIIIVGLKDLVAEDEYMEFEKMISYKKYTVLLIEHRQHAFDNSEFSYIIDEDLCSI